IKKGDLVLIPFPFTNLAGTKNRPAVILIATTDDITVSFITTQLKWQEESDVKLEPSEENGLKITSLIRLSKMTTIEKGLVIGKLGTLTELELNDVNRGLIELLQ